MIRTLILATALAVGAVYTPISNGPDVAVESVALGVGSTEQAAIDAAWNRLQVQLDQACQAEGHDRGDFRTGTEATSPVGGGYLTEVSARAVCR